MPQGPVPPHSDAALERARSAFAEGRVIASAHFKNDRAHRNLDLLRLRSALEHPRARTVKGPVLDGKHRSELYEFWGWLRDFQVIVVLAFPDATQPATAPTKIVTAAVLGTPGGALPADF